MEYKQTCIQIIKLLDEFVNCPTPRYITLYCHSRRWLLTSNLQIQVGTLCVLVANNTNYIGYDYGTRYFTCTKGTTFQSIVVERLN
jgi:hypothetical protein